MLGLNRVLLFGTERAFKAELVIRVSKWNRPRGLLRLSFYGVDTYPLDCIVEIGGQQFIAPLFSLF